MKLPFPIQRMSSVSMSDNNTAGTGGHMEEDKEEENKFASNDESTDSGFDTTELRCPISSHQIAPKTKGINKKKAGKYSNKKAKTLKMKDLTTLIEKI